MPMFSALDVSKKEAQLYVVDVTWKCIWRGKLPTNSKDVATVLLTYAKQLEKVGLETGSWSSWLLHGLSDLSFKLACMDARQACAELSVTVNKTDANDAEGLAHLLRTGLFREVRVKPWCDLRRRALLRARATLLRTVVNLGNAIRSALRLSGFNMAAGPGSGGARAFERRAAQHLTEQPGLVSVVMPLLDALRVAREQVAHHERSIRAVVRSDERCQLPLIVPGVGHLNALASLAAIGDTRAFPSGRMVSPCRE